MKTRLIKEKNHNQSDNKNEKILSSSLYKPIFFIINLPNQVEINKIKKGIIVNKIIFITKAIESSQFNQLYEKNK